MLSSCLKMNNIEQIYNLLTSNFKLFLAIAFRIGGLFFTAPFFGHRSIHFLLKLGLVFSVSLILLPITGATIPALPSEFPSYLLLLVTQALIGALVGCLFYLLFWGIEMGGSLLGLQLNLESGDEEEGMSPISRLQVFLGLLIFVSLNGHHLLISSVFQSFELVPIGELNLSAIAFDKIIHFSSVIFIIALKIAAPVIVTLFILDLLIGIIGRTIPQTGFYSNFAPLRLGAGLLILALSFPVFGTIMEKLLLNSNVRITEILRSLK